MLDKLLLESTQLQPLSSSASQEFQEQIPALLAAVNTILSNHPNISELNGNAAAQAILDGTSYHAKFMANVFYFNDYRLLCRVLLWFYRVYQCRGYSPSYFAVLFTAWQRSLEKTLSVTAAEEIISKYQWLMAKHDLFLALSQTSLSEETFACNANQSSNSQILESCRESLLNGDHHSCLALAEVDCPDDIRSLYCSILQPCLYSIGQLWERDEISAAQEHLASATVSRIMQMQYAKIASLNKHRKGVAVITSAPGEYHSLGANMASDLLELDNWQTYFLGGNTPRSDLLDLLHEKQPFLLGISVVMPFNLIKTHELIRAIRADSHLSDIRILVGGPTFFLDAELAKKIGADEYANDISAAVMLADELWQQHTSTAE